MGSYCVERERMSLTWHFGMLCAQRSACHITSRQLEPPFCMCMAAGDSDVTMCGIKSARALRILELLLVSVTHDTSMSCLIVSLVMSKPILDVGWHPLFMPFC